MAKRIFSQTFVVVGALIERDSKFLLVKEAGSLADGGKWNQPAGWLDVGEQPIEAVVREVKEETGYDFEPQAILGIYSLVREDLRKYRGETPHAVKIIYKGKISGEPAPLYDDVTETRWFTGEAIEAMSPAELRDVDIKQYVRDCRVGKHYPLELVTHTVSE